MGHDHHFLERLDRASRVEVEFALSLYRDAEGVRFLIDNVSLPKDAGRIALSIAPEGAGPHVVVTREGQFVTCLGAGMSTKDLPVVPRGQIDGLLARLDDLRERRLVAKGLTRKGEEEIDITSRLFTRGEALSREEFVAISAWQPMFRHSWFVQMLESNAELLDHRELARTITHKSPRTEKALEAYWKLAWGMGHLMLLSSMGDKTWLDELVPAFEESKLTLSWVLTGHGMYALAARGWWGAARLGRALMPSYKMVLAGTQEPLRLLDAMVGLAGIGIRHSNLRAEAKKALLAPPTEKNGALSDYRREVAGLLVSALDDPDSFNGVTLEVGRDLYMLWTSHLPEASPFRYAHPEDIPEDLARTMVLRHEADLFGNEKAVSLAICAVATVARARPEDFFLPKDLAKAINNPWTPSRTIDLLARYATWHRDEPIRIGPTPGRNEPCSCGSGKKFKKCCGG